MSLEVNLTDKDIFLGQFRTVNFTVYVTGTTPAMIQADPLANRADLIGIELAWYVRQKPLETDPARIFKTTSDGGIVLDDPGQGQCHTDLDVIDTVNLAPGTYFHTLWNETDADVLAYGTLDLSPPAQQS